MNTICEVLEVAERERRRVTLIDSGLRAETIYFDELMALARRAAAALIDRGVERGDRLLLALPTGREFLAVFFGSLVAGIVPCPISPLQGASSLERLARLTRALAVRAIVSTPDVTRAARLDALALTPEDLLGVGEPRIDHHPSPDDVAFFQLTSGSTGLPKGVVLTHRAVLANLRQIAVGSGIVAGDVMVSWLPLFHDMGLVAGVLLPIATGMELVLSNPLAFLRRPAHWAQAIHRYRGTHSLAPTFAYRYIADRVREHDLAGLDLGSWRVAYIGAEPVHHDVLERFEQRFSACGLSPTTLFPCYGMAEATLAISVKPFRERYRTLTVGRTALARDGVAQPPAGPIDAQVLVSCGRAVEGTQLAILDDHGEALPERRLGEIAIRGPSLFSGYLGEAPQPRERDFHTGDLGFLADGELFIAGRRKELIIVAGENYHPAEIEWVAARVEGVRAGRVAAFGIDDTDLGTQHLCVSAEAERGAPTGDLAVAIRRAVREALGLVVSEVEIVSAGTLPVTTSGKIRRGEVRERYRANLTGNRPPESAQSG